MFDIPWRSRLARSLHKHSRQPQSRYVQLATVDSNSRPTNRTVVFRGFLGNTDLLRFVTDIRSEKVRHIQAQPWSELCWYFPDTREQYRIAGTLTLISATTQDEKLQAARVQMWKELSESSRSQFAWPHPKSPRLESEDIQLDEETINADIPLSTFCLLLLEPQSVDYLELRGTPQHRFLYNRTESACWVQQFVNS